jgi:hypothetical protein
MKKKPTAVRSWNNSGDIEIGFYARSLHKAAQSLIATLDLQPNPKTGWDACPVILLYRQAVELHLKTLVGEGCDFLPSPTDHITLSQTHSIRWLAQIVCRIIRAVRWESEFKCEGIASLAEFSTLINELDALGPLPVAVHRHPDGRVPSQLEPVKVVHFAKKLDALLALMDVTADALGAAWDQGPEVSREKNFYAGDTIKTTIQ